MAPTNYVPERFARTVLLHIFLNIQAAADEATPLILGIHGPSGEGKTHQCMETLAAAGVETVLVSGGQMESPDAGRPAELIREAYRHASDHRSARRPAAVIINDLDTAVGDWGANVQTTVNRQIVLDELMNLADVPSTVDRRPVLRSPIIVTGNDFTKLYQPLVRFGRMRMLPWIPTLDEKVAVVASILPELLESEVRHVVTAFPSFPVSFFAQVRRVCREDAIWQFMAKQGPRQAIEAALAGQGLVFSDRLSLTSVLAAADLLRVSHQMTNHLEQR